MWIIPKNYQLSSAFAADMVASKEDLTLLGSSIESSLMWRSKPSLLRTWLQRWNRVSWFQRLSSRILKPSQHTYFETALTSSLEDIRASRSQPQESDLAPKTPDTSGHLYGDTLNQLDLFGASLRTLKDTSALASEKSLATWKEQVIKQRGEYSQRLKSARLTSESGFTYSVPTPTVGMEAPNKNANTKGPKNLMDVATGDWQHLVPQTWLTPTVQDSKHSGVNPGPNGKRDLLVNQVNWQTPVANDSVERAKGNYNSRGEAKLSAQVKMWPTPRASEAEKSSRTVAGAQREVARGKGADLSTVVRAMHVETFPTPAARDYRSVTGREHLQRDNHMQNLNVAAVYRQTWPTPCARDYIGRSGAGRQERRGNPSDTLPNAVWNYLIPTVGDKNKVGHLNPDWVEWLMGVPTGWTDLGSWETE